MLGTINQYKEKTGTISCFCLFLFIFIMPSLSLMAASVLDDDEIKISKIQNPDSSEVKKDSIIYNKPIFRHGATSLLDDLSKLKIRKKDLLWNNYTGIFDILNNEMSAYPLSLGGFCNYNQLSVFSSNGKNVKFNFNNRPVIEQQFGSSNIDMYPTEFIENIEVFFGSDAVIFSGNSSGSLINIQEPVYNTSSPYTKLWLNEYGTTFIASDGVFSQNILPNTNMTFGFRKIHSKGEFDNQTTDGWNIRGLLRFNLSDRSCLSISENFYNHFNEMNGGVDEAASENQFIPVDAYVKYIKFTDRVIKHDITATYSNILNKYNSSALSISLFSSLASYERELDSEISGALNDSATYLRYPSNYFGASGRFEQKVFNLANLIIGSEVSYHSLNKTIFSDDYNGLNYSGFGRLSLSLGDKLNLSGGIRLNSQLNKFFNAFGGKIQYILNTDSTRNSSLYGDISISQSNPSPSDGLGLKNENHFLIIGGYSNINNESNLNLSIWLRAIDNPIFSRLISNSSGFVLKTDSYNGTNSQLLGFNLDYSAPISDKIFMRLTGIFQLGKYYTEEFSEIRTLLKLDGYYKILAGRSELRLGLNLNLTYQNFRETFYPQKRTLIYLDNESNFFYNGINLYAHAKLGNTYFKLNVSNLLGAGYYFIASYPGIGRYINFSVNWPFLD
jgi:hypothetical protein